MALITTMNFHELKQSDSLDFCQEAKLTIANGMTPDSNFKVEFDTFASAIDSAMDMYKPEVDSTVTAELITLADGRDWKERTLLNLSTAYSKHYDPELATAGKAIMDCINKNGEAIYRQPYKEETFSLRKIYSDLTTEPALIEAVTTCGLTKVLEDMNTDNTAFYNCFRNRMMNQVDQVSCAEALSLTIKAYRELVFKIEACAAVLVANDYSGLISDLNKVINEYKS